MTKEEKKMLIITSCICLCPMMIGILFYSKLPNQIAIHFDVNNQPNGYASKNFFVFGFPIIMSLFQLVAYGGSILQDNNKIANKRMNNVVRWVIPILSIVMYIVTILYALEYDIDFRVIVMSLLGILFIVMGNYLPKTKNTRTIHLGVSNSLNDKDYAQVARISGYGMILNGLLMIFSIFFDVMVSVLIVGLLVVETIVLTMYTLVKVKGYEK